jgi:hypothetical protein
VKLASGETDDVTRTGTGTTLGTVAYMSPEQIRGPDVHESSDIWSLGVVLYEMLAGCRPFAGKEDLAVVSSILTDAPPRIDALRPDVPPALHRIVARALEKPVEARYTSAGEMLGDLEKCQAELRGDSGRVAVQPARRRSPALAIVAAAIAVAVAIPAFMMYGRSSRERTARNTIPDIVKLIQADNYAGAFALARKVERDLPAGDQALTALWPQFSAMVSMATAPPGAEVFYEPYAASSDAWEHLGQTPFNGVRMPRGTFRLRIEKNGYATRLMASTNPGIFMGNMAKPLEKPTPLVLPLPAAGEPQDVVRIPGQTFPVSLSGFNTNEEVELADYSIDRTEVTNDAFKKFVDAGGYATNNWNTAPVAQFVDSTGRPGPSTWELGRFPAGQGDFPVGGVSWYEADAYCRAQGKSLPTLYHWARAALSPVEILSPLAPSIIPVSNYGRKGPARAGEYRGLGPYGTVDMAGNVREWVSNEAESGRRWILGGSWKDETWMMVVPNSQPPLDRSATNGFRCARMGPAALDARLTGPVTIHPPNTAKAVSKEVFDVFKRQLAYVKAPVDLRVESRDEKAPDWIRERITVAAAGDAERTPAILFLPRNAAPPFQLSVFFPGLGVFVGRASSAGITQPAPGDFLLTGGRAFLYPIWKGSYERWDPFLTRRGDEYLRTFRTRMADWRQDLGRLLDALGERKDIDSNRIAYFGASFGASTMFPLLALEDRFKTAVLMAPGYTYRALPPEADAVNYAPRVTMPVLMVGGRHDYVLPYESSQKPMFDDLGTPADRKKHIVFDAGHFDFPRSELIRDVLGWLDQYLGPVKAK